ncbi:MAG: VWA domain-containing protein [Acidobacteria bacterium]|nr:VWA domain-containing protein [Acidobacteriota bacterium]
MRTRSKCPRWAERGVIFVLLTVSLIMILPLVGLAFDCGMLYMIRTKLSAAVDAAVLAGARSLDRGMDLSSQVASAGATATEYFHANFPSGVLATANTQLSVQVTETGNRTRRVTMVASTDSPLYFLRILRHDWAQVRVSAQASRRDVNLILLMDRSGSILSAGADDEVRAAAHLFVDKFSEGRDRVGMVSFSGPYHVSFPYGFDFKSRSPQNIHGAIDAMVFAGNTGTAQALWQGYQQLVSINEVGALNVIVFFTDGRPTALTANFPVKTVSDQRYGDGNSPYSSTSTTYTMPASSCSSSTAKLGFISAPINTYSTRGTTWGAMLTQAASPTHNEWTVAPNCSNCAFAPGTTQSYRTRMRRDIAYIPDTDPNGNSMLGYMPLSSSNGGRFPTGHPYAGRIRPDGPLGVRYAANNLADNIATRIRNDNGLRPLIYAIGLGGTSAETIDHTLLRRIANDPASPIHDPSQPVGMYVYSPTTQQLGDAFLKIASEILRLTQ